MKKILVVDHDRRVAADVLARWIASGDGAFEIVSLNEAEDRIISGHIDALVIASLPDDVSRVDACARIRRLPFGGRILLLVAVPRKLARTRIRCLEAGADATLDEPLRADAVAAWLRPRQADSAANTILEFGEVVMSTEEVKVKVRGIRLALSPTAFRLMRIFLENPGRIISRQELILRMDGGNIRSSRTIDSIIRRLRAAMSDIGVPDPFVAVPQLGYSLGNPVSDRVRPSSPKF